MTFSVSNALVLLKITCIDTPGFEYYTRPLKFSHAILNHHGLYWRTYSKHILQPHKYHIFTIKCFSYVENQLYYNRCLIPLALNIILGFTNPAIRS